MMIIEKKISLNEMADQSSLFGNYDENTKAIEKEFEVKIINRDDNINIEGEPENVRRAVKVIERIDEMLKNNEVLNLQNVEYLISLIKDGQEDSMDIYTSNCICNTSRGRPIKPKTVGQKKYIESIKRNVITIAVGPAGTGKTFLAVAMAVAAFKKDEINKIVLTRPAVEAGESLGFLPGDLQNKVDPYLRPLNDALFEMLGDESYQKLIERQNLEIAPLAYMRGRTLDNSFIILDEAQNTTREQMKMFLTRIGVGSKVVITGDLTQIDLSSKEKSGLLQATKILKNINDISIMNLSKKDVVRNKIVKEIINAYEMHTKGE